MRNLDVVGVVFVSYVREGFSLRSGVEGGRSARMTLPSLIPESRETNGSSINAWFDPDASGGVLPIDDEYCVALIAGKPEETLRGGGGEKVPQRGLFVS